VLQSTLDFLEHGYDVHVPSDGVSSCNNDEVPLGLERMRVLYVPWTPILSTGDTKGERRLVVASRPNFKVFANLIKAEK
ncbi:hypothetical protein V8E53_014123, partial [Lactarius tabidus]